jgi:restriction system protein
MFPKYNGTKLIKNKELNQLIKASYYSIYIGLINEIVRLDSNNLLNNVILNAFYKGVDTRTGHDFKMCLMTSKIIINDFKKINLLKINPKDTFKYFSGKGIPNPNNLIKVEPIRFFDKSKYKLIESNEIISSFSSETNLAAIDWKDFEILVKDIFELEFKEFNIEIKNTQHTNDGGIDVVAFNPNPYSGGIILLQAKRYTNTVSPEPVRALKGSMDQYNAIRGILVTTSDFGGSSKEYANQHNITLINGQELLELLKKHNYNFHIDLKQAKLMNNFN